MTGVISTAVAAIVTHLESVFTDAEIVAGTRAGVSRDKDRIVVFNPGFPSVSPDISFSKPQIVIRYFVSLSKIPADAATPDPSSLYDAQEALLAAFAGMDVVGSFAENFALVQFDSEVNDDPEEWRVDVTVTGYTFNPAKHAA